MSNGRKVVLALMISIVIGGLVYACWPVINGAVLSAEYTSEAEEFLETQASIQAADIECENLYPELRAAMEAYNEQIYEENQAELTDEYSYETEIFNLTEYGIEDGIAAVISIPRLDLEMPIYLGATSANMANGAAQLSYTSCPIGGENTNCVIAGHRGWGGAAYFRYLDELEIGDEVTITNLWETLHYRVTGIQVIYPNDVESILIQEGKDMVTLLTCHPYASGGRYRLLVFCERADEQT